MQKMRWFTTLAIVLCLGMGCVIALPNLMFGTFFLPFSEGGRNNHTVFIFYTGPRTLAEVRRRTPAEIIARYNSRRLLFLTQLNDTTWREFGRGLVARVAQNLQV